MKSGAIFMTVILAIMLSGVRAQMYIPFTSSAPPIPVVFAGNDTTVATGTPVQLQALVSGGTAPYIYSWAPATAVNNPSLPNPVANVSISTLLTLTVTDDNGCVATDEINISITTTGLEEINLAGFMIYPNPSTGRIIIGREAPLNHEAFVEIRDLCGKLIHSMTLAAGTTAQAITLNTPGYYLVGITSGYEHITKSLIIF